MSFNNDFFERKLRQEINLDRNIGYLPFQGGRVG
jgi:hypothetical protein